ENSARSRRPSKGEAMSKVKVLVEIESTQPEAFSTHAAAARSLSESTDQVNRLAASLAVPGLEVDPAFAPVPLFSEKTVRGSAAQPGFSTFASSDTNPDTSANTVVLAAEVDAARVEELKEQPGVRVYPNSTLTLYQEMELFAVTGTIGAIDCRPFRP